MISFIFINMWNWCVWTFATHIKLTVYQKMIRNSMSRGYLRPLLCEFYSTKQQQNWHFYLIFTFVLHPIKAQRNPNQWKISIYKSTPAAIFHITSTVFITSCEQASILLFVFFIQIYGTPENIIIHGKTNPNTANRLSILYQKYGRLG